MPRKISQMLELLEADGWELKRTTGSHRHFTHPDKPGLVTVAGKPSATLHPKTEASILRQAGRLAEGGVMNGYVVVFEGDEESGFSSYSPDLPGVVAAGATFTQTRELMLEAMIEHLAYLHDTGQSVPEPVTNARVTIVDVSAA